MNFCNFQSYLNLSQYFWRRKVPFTKRLITNVLNPEIAWNSSQWIWNKYLFEGSKHIPAQMFLCNSVSPQSWLRSYCYLLRSAWGRANNSLDTIATKPLQTKISFPNYGQCAQFLPLSWQIESLLWLGPFNGFFSFWLFSFDFVHEKQ